MLLLAAGWRLDMRYTDYVETVEVNTFGEQPRTALIYRDTDGSILDWRWLSCREQIPQSLGDGRYLAVWCDQGKPRAVHCRSVRFTRTREDRELAERGKLPEDRRRKLSR